LFPGDLRPGDLLFYFALPCFEFAIQIDATYLKEWSMSLQYMLIPTVGVYKGTTGTMEDNPVINQWIPAYSATHLVTSCD
jgi:CDP-diacylglycerol pyrophosphatase